MPPTHARAPVIDTSQAPRPAPVIIWADCPALPTVGERATTWCSLILVALVLGYMAWQFWGRP